MSGFVAPEVLVLGGGGILGEVWMNAVLVGLEDAADFEARQCEGYVGTSAGSIVAAALVAGLDPRARLGELPEQPAAEPSELEDRPGLLGRGLRLGIAAGGRVGAPLAAVGLRSTEVAGALVRRAALSRVPNGRRSLGQLGSELDRAGASWDGRLLVSAVDVESGRRVMFGSPDAPSVSVGTAVEASCAIPGVFRPIEVNGRSYCDGGAWSPTSLDRAQAGRGTRVLCLNPTGSMRPNVATPFAALGLLSRSIAGVEALTLERRGARVETVSPDAASLAAIGPNLMDPRPRAKVIAAGLAQGRALGRR
jgi:NTE family protein